MLNVSEISLSIQQLALLFTFAVLIHNLEEAIWLPTWSVSAGRWYRPVGAFDFRLAVAVLSLLLVAALAAALVSGARSSGAYLFAGYVCAMAANAIFPHAFVTVLTGTYMPGTATGLLLNLPIGLMLTYRMVNEDYVQAPTLVWVAPVVALILVVSIPVLFTLAKWIRRIGAAACRIRDIAQNSVNLDVKNRDGFDA